MIRHILSATKDHIWNLMGEGVHQIPLTWHRSGTRKVQLWTASFKVSVDRPFPCPNRHIYGADSCYFLSQMTSLTEMGTPIWIGIRPLLFGLVFWTLENKSIRQFCSVGLRQKEDNRSVPWNATVISSSHRSREVTSLLVGRSVIFDQRFSRGFHKETRSSLVLSEEQWVSVNYKTKNGNYNNNSKNNDSNNISDFSTAAK